MIALIHKRHPYITWQATLWMLYLHDLAQAGNPKTSTGLRWILDNSVLDSPMYFLMPHAPALDPLPSWIVLKEYFRRWPLNKPYTLHGFAGWIGFARRRALKRSLAILPDVTSDLRTLVRDSQPIRHANTFKGSPHISSSARRGSPLLL